MACHDPSKCFKGWLWKRGRTGERIIDSFEVPKKLKLGIGGSVSRHPYTGL